MQRLFGPGSVCGRQAIRVLSLLPLVTTVSLCGFGQANPAVPPVSPPQPVLITQPNHPLHPLSLNSATFDPDACNRIPDATHGLQGAIPSDADLQIAPGTQAHPPQSVDEVKCALRLSVFFSYRADALLAANPTPTDSQKQTAVNDYQRGDEILATLARYFESHSDQPSTVNDAIVAGVKPLAIANATSHISAVSMILLADPLAPDDSLISALTPDDYTNVVHRIDGYGKGVATDADLNSNTFLNYTFPPREAESLRNFLAAFFTRAIDPQTPDSFFASMMQALGPPPSGWNPEARSLMMLSNLQIVVGDSIQEIVVSKWLANHKMGTVSTTPLIGDALWIQPANYQVKRSMTIGQHDGSNCGSKSDDNNSFTSMHEPVTIYQCQFNGGDFSQASYPIIFADTNINPWGLEAPANLYAVTIQSMLRGGHDPGHGIFPSPNNLTASLVYNLTANANIPECNDLTKCSAIVDLYYFDNRSIETGSTTDGVLGSLASSATYQGSGMSAPTALPKNQHVLVDRSSSPVHVTFTMGRNDHHDQACCYHTVFQNVGVSAIAADPVYPILPPPPVPAPKPGPAPQPPGPGAHPQQPGTPSPAASTGASPVFTAIPMPKRPPSALALENYLLLPNVRLEALTKVRYTIGQIPADRRMIPNPPQFTSRFEDTYLHFIELALLEALPPAALDGYDKKSVDLARVALFQEARRLYLDTCRNQINSDNQYLELVNIPAIVQDIDNAYNHILTTGGTEAPTPLDFLNSIHNFANDPSATSVQTSLTAAQQAAHDGDRQTILNSLAKLRDDLWHLNNTLKKRHDAMLLELSNLDPPAVVEPGGH